MRPRIERLGKRMGPSAVRPPACCVNPIAEIHERAARVANQIRLASPGFCGMTRGPSLLLPHSGQRSDARPSKL